MLVGQSGANKPIKWCAGPCWTASITALDCAGGEEKATVIQESKESSYREYGVPIGKPSTERVIDAASNGVGGELVTR